MIPRIKIITGKIHSGKTTSLFKFVNEKKKCDGILAPIVNGKRILFHISTRTIKELEVEEKSVNTVSIGKYHFLRESFIWANKNILQSFNSSAKYIIIDEIGKLELEGTGLHKSTQEILSKIRNSNKYLVLVIRDYLLEDALDYYQIEKHDYEILQF